MKTPNNHLGQKRVLLAVYPDQKVTHRVRLPDGKFLDLYMGEKSWKLNGWDGNPTVGRAMSDCDEISAGDHVLTHHNAFENEGKEVCGMEALTDPGEKVFAIEKSLLWLGINAEGTIYCIDNSVICRRIYKPIQVTESGIIGGVSQEKYTNYLYVEKVPDHITEIKKGDIIVVAKFSDVELKYVWENVHKSIIRINFVRDFLGAVVEDIEYEFEKNFAESI